MRRGRSWSGCRAPVEYDIRNAFYAQLQRLPLAYFHANRTGDLMSRATNDLSAVRMMVGPAVMYAVEHGADLRGVGRAAGLDQRTPGAHRADAAAARDRRHAIVRPPDPRSLRAHSGAVVRPERRHAGVAGRRSRRARLPTGTARAGALPHRQPGVPRAQSRAHPPAGAVLSQPRLPHGPVRAGGALARWPRRHRRADDARRAGGLQRLSGDAVVADDRLWLGHQPGPARPRLVDAHARRARRRPGDRRPRGDEAATCGPPTSPAR